LDNKPLVIQISGGFFNGKDTLAEEVHKIFREDYAMQMSSFSTPIKELAYELGWNGEKDNNGRVLLQFIGTEWGRDTVDRDIWVKKLYKKISDYTEILIIPDTRFDNEVEFLREKSLKTVVVKIEREDPPEYNNKELHEHISEKGLSEEFIDITLFAEENCDFEKLAREVVEVVEEVEMELIEEWRQSQSQNRESDLSIDPRD
jgi:hypothetical protein